MEAFREVADSIGFAPTDAGTLRDGGRLMQVGGGPLSAVPPSGRTERRMQ
jgi:8-hydroxy-5-deazaflavin:NADPH oxidoreductase